MDKNKLIQNILAYQKKLVKILKAEERLSNIFPINKLRLEKQTRARNNVINNINNELKVLINMGEKFKLKRTKKLEKS